MTCTHKKILIVDDEHDVGWTLKVILEKYGFCVNHFTSSISALKQFRSNFYDLVILDIRLPELNGFELYRELKLRDPKIKTLFITALNSVESYNTHENTVYPKMGERHFLKKP